MKTETKNKIDRLKAIAKDIEILQAKAPQGFEEIAEIDRLQKEILKYIDKL